MVFVLVLFFLRFGFCEGPFASLAKSKKEKGVDREMEGNESRGKRGGFEV